MAKKIVPDNERLIRDATKNQVVINTSNVFEAKHLTGRKFDDPEVQSEIKRFSVKVFSTSASAFSKLTPRSSTVWCSICLFSIGISHSGHHKPPSAFPPVSAATMALCPVLSSNTSMAYGQPQCFPNGDSSETSNYLNPYCAHPQHHPQTLAPMPLPTQILLNSS
ncbi:unnamed protein product [Cyclocybe aegerita]|uniref:Uncharacterized protein n=1 Tax=Cyclocybe aegerita TaxID=1973307 RepID=A0A8S0WNZ5_CYCAE|nr:unnamed protein product [Cyclocybe aegerita]